MRYAYAGANKCAQEISIQILQEILQSTSLQMQTLLSIRNSNKLIKAQTVRTTHDRRWFFSDSFSEICNSQTLASYFQVITIAI